MLERMARCIIQQECKTNKHVKMVEILNKGHYLEIKKHRRHDT